MSREEDEGGVTGRVLLALGVVGTISFVVLTALFAGRLADGFGITYTLDDIEVEPGENGTVKAQLTVHAWKAEDRQEFILRDSTTALTLEDDTQIDGSVSARSCASRSPSCARVIRLTYPLPDADALDGAWSVTADLRWRSEDLSVVASGHLTLEREGTRLA